LTTVPAIALQCRRSTHAGGTIEFDHSRRNMPRPDSRSADFISGINPEACRMTELDDVSGSDDFYEAFLAPVESRILRTVWRIIRNPGLVQDTVQDALTAIWRCRDKIRLHPNPQALMLKIATDVSCDALRRSLRHQRHEQPLEDWETNALSREPPTMQMEQDQLERGIRTAITNLPRNQASAVLMRLVHEHPYSLVACTLGCSEATARVHVMRGRARLRVLLSRLGAGFYGRKADVK
jgi:RNA polymerase sigma factor (sigma-70 family)